MGKFREDAKYLASSGFQMLIGGSSSARLQTAAAGD